MAFFVFKKFSRFVPVRSVNENKIDSADVQGTLEGIAEEIVKVVETETVKGIKNA